MTPLSSFYICQYSDESWIAIKKQLVNPWWPSLWAWFPSRDFWWVDYTFYLLLTQFWYTNVILKTLTSALLFFSSKHSCEHFCDLIACRAIDELLSLWLHLSLSPSHLLKQLCLPWDSNVLGVLCIFFHWYQAACFPLSCSNRPPLFTPKYCLASCWFQ